jgi:ABC-type transporter Mla maintaining outer membrane lipid asymmetry permease subunit MlaE
MASAIRSASCIAARNGAGPTSVIGAQIREEIDIMSIIQFRSISIIVSFNADARFVDIKIPLRE